jgi:hypothetical protein
MMRWMTALGTVVVTMTSTGCAVVIDPLQPNGTTDAVAILFQDLPAPSGSQQSLDDIDISSAPDSLVLMWSNQPELCSNPQIGGVCADEIVWQGVLVLPPDLVHVGLVDLSDPRIAAYDYVFANSVCAGGGGGGSPPGGTMEILSTDAISIKVNLIDGIPGSSSTFTYSDGSMVTSDVTIKGTFDIPRCEVAP